MSEQVPYLLAMLERRLLADYDCLDILTQLIEEKSIRLAPVNYQRLIQSVAVALCDEFGGSLAYTRVNDEPGASIHLTDVEPESIWCCYGEEEV